MNIKITEKVKCKNCQKPFLRLIKKNTTGHGIRGKGSIIRHKNCITCSKKCSIEYNSYKRKK